MIYVGFPDSTYPALHRIMKQWLIDRLGEEGPDTWFTCEPDASDIYRMGAIRFKPIRYGYVIADHETATAFKLFFTPGPIDVSDI